MRAWSSPDVPILDAPDQPHDRHVAIFDTASRSKIEAATSSTARLYVCGITPYDATHLGHAFTYLAFDLLQRCWLAQGLSVRYTQNVTDVDDPLLERAQSLGIDWVELAERETELFRADMTALRILAPQNYIGAVESIDLVIEMIRGLKAAGAIYSVDDDLYFDVSADAEFGAVSGLTTQRMLPLFAERGGDPDRAGKRNQLDCLVWQAERPYEPAWDSPFGRGRPGWHIECAAIALEHLGPDFDVQGGGSDLVFPHHEMSRSEAVVCTEEQFARAFMHVGMVGFEGEKMSKSKGNLVLVSTLRENGVDPAAIRLALLSHHYRDDWEWFDSDLQHAQDRLRTWHEATEQPTGASVGATLQAVRAALFDDLNAPAALTAVDQWAATGGDDPAAPGQLAAIVDALLGVDLVGVQ